MTNATFVNRITEVDQTDYISLANDQINKNGTIDVDGTIFQNALNQYNEGIIKGSVERLDVPEGFCGYIDPDTGRFRVEPDPFVGNLRSGTLYPDNATNPNDVPPLPVTTYPIDQCLAVGLPGSYKYTTGRCGIDDGDKLCSGMNWFGGSGGTETCGTGGGINSNVGLAGSNQQQGPEPAGPQGQGSGAWLYADKEARRLYPDERSPEDIAARRFPTCVESGAGFVNGIRHDTGNPDVSVFDYRFNVNDPKVETNQRRYFRIWWDKYQNVYVAHSVLVGFK